MPIVLSMSDVLDETITVKVTHVGGPWDGQEEKREITKDQTSFTIAQDLVTVPEDGLPFLHHHYDIVVRDTIRLIYRGYTPSATFGL